MERRAQVASVRKGVQSAKIAENPIKGAFFQVPCNNGLQCDLNRLQREAATVCLVRGQSEHLLSSIDSCDIESATQQPHRVLARTAGQVENLLPGGEMPFQMSPDPRSQQLV